MTLRHMRIFIVVYQEMNITKASNKLHMTQPAVTRAIKEIETHYDIQLFERLNHKLYRTRISDELYSHALHIVNSDRKSTRLNSSHRSLSRMPSSA